MKKDVYQVITNRIIQLLEAGTVPWHKPWKAGHQAPRNLVIKKAYRGINLFLLHSAAYPSPYWLTYKQVQTMNGRIRKDEKSWPVVFWKLFEDKEKGETKKKIPVLRYHSVFNTVQCDGITAPGLPESPQAFEPIQQCEEIVAKMPCRPALVQHRYYAFYSPPEDTVYMPQANSFESPEAYYDTLFHELTHSTGHASRLNRPGITGPIQFGSDSYSREELVAEMGAAFLCGHCHCDIHNITINRSASYIQSWLKRLKDDRKLVVQAAAQAQKAADFILGITLPKSEATHD